MITLIDLVQGSEEWLKARLGVITASRAHEFAASPKLAPLPENIVYEKVGKEHVYFFNGKEFKGTNKTTLQNEVRSTLPMVYPEIRQKYMAELVAQCATGLIPEGVNFKQTEWGNEHEEDARSYFEFETGLDVSEVGFIYKDKSHRFGISPDGLIKGKKIGLEIKCPFTSKVFVEFATCEKIKQEYIEQCQFSMWVTGYEAWYFANYDPRMKGKKLHYELIQRDQFFMDKYDNSYLKFISDMDKMLDKLGCDFGSQWGDE